MKPLLRIGSLRVFASDNGRSSIAIRRRKPTRQRQVAVEVSRNHVCPFCHYIGPPLLCGCVTELYDTLKMADEDLVTEEYTRNTISRHADRVRLLNDALQRDRQAASR